MHLPPRLSRLVWVPSLLAGSVLLGSCDRMPETPKVPAAQPAPDVQADWFGWGSRLLLKCSPLPFDSTSQVIGPEGGTLTVGSNTLTVPPGALGAPTMITGVVHPDTVNAIRFSPQGLVFQQPAQLVMSYANCGLLESLIPKRIAYTTDDLFILQIIPSLDDVLNRTVTGQVFHFSQYAVAW